MRKRFCADKHDFLNAGFVAFLDLKYQVDTVVGQLDDLRIDRHIETAAALINFDDPLNVSLNGRTRKRATRFRLRLGLKLLVFGLFIALERDPVDHRVLGHRYNDAVPGMVDADVGKQAGCDHGLECFVLLLGTYPAAWARPEIGTDSVRLDPAVTLDDDGIGRLRYGNARGQDCPAASADKYAAED